MTAEQDDPAACIGAINRDIDAGGHGPEPYDIIVHAARILLHCQFSRQV